AHGTSETELVEPFRIVIDNAASQDLPLPGIRRNFESLQLPQNFERSSFARDLSAWGQVLPLQQPLHELSRGHRLDLLAQGCDGQAVDAGEQPALAPFDLGVLCGN